MFHVEHFNKSFTDSIMSLKTRATTGLVFGIIMIGATIASPYTCALLFIAIGICCLWEYSDITNRDDNSDSIMALIRKLLTVILGILPALIVIGLTQELIILEELKKQSPLILPIIFGLFIFELFSKATKPFDQIGRLLLAIIYIGIPIALVEMIALSQMQYGRFLVLAMLFIVWASDSFAYLGGSKIGKTPFFKRISPKKTWEGIACGVIGAMVFGYICSLIFPTVEYSISQWLIIAVVGCIFGILGDLVESMLKRSLGIKDSGTILPGHGGFLDRFDAFLLLVPFVVFTIIYILKDARFTSWF